MNMQSNFFKALIRLSCALVFLVGLLAVPQGIARAATIFMVDTLTDAPDINTTNGICFNGVDGCSLRAAVEQASSVSSSANPVTINFSSALSGSTLALSLGTLMVNGNYISIDGGTHNIILSGADLPAGQSLFQISGSHNLLENLSITGSHGHGVQIGDVSGAGQSSYNSLNALKIYGNGAAGVKIESTTTGGGNYNQIWNSLIGSSNSSTCSPGEKNGMDGIYIYPEIYGTLITNNTIICNGVDGIVIAGPDYYTTIQNNLIGTDGIHTGLGNTYAGIEGQDDANTSIINNIISGNGDSGILMSRSSNASIYNNKIGTNASGNTAIPNGKDGIQIVYNSTANIIGSATDAAKRNIISGNVMNGIAITGGSRSNVLNGNYIGLGADGLTPIPNGEAGVSIEGADNNVLSTSGDATVPQFISGNGREGVYITNSDGTVINNRTFIGVAADMFTARGNTLEGVKLDTITTSSIISPGKVMYNGEAGIAVIGETSVYNWINPISIGQNAHLAIDLGNDGYNYIGSHSAPGPNNWINHPIVNMPGSGGFSGITYPGAVVFFYRANGDPSADQGGGTFLSSVPADAATGDFSYTFPMGFTAVTMVACDSSNNCSEMSPKVVNSFSYIFLPFLKR